MKETLFIYLVIPLLFVFIMVPIVVVGFILQFITPVTFSERWVHKFKNLLP